MTTIEAPTRLLTPSKVTAWLDCAHFLTLQHEVDDGQRPEPSGALGALARLLMEKGGEHEQACLEELWAKHADVCVVPERNRAESFAAFVERTGDLLPAGHDVLYQMPFVHKDMRGIADFLVKKDLGDGRFTYEPIDAKLARSEAKPGHVLQLCFYADAIEARLGAPPEHVHLWLGSGRMESIRLADVRAYWRRLRAQLRRALAPNHERPPTKPVPCNHCAFCPFADTCDAEWRAADALQFVAGIRATDRAKLEAAQVTTLAGLATLQAPVPELDPDRQARLVKQAALQVKAREAPGPVPPFERVEPTTDEQRAAGLAALPAPDDGDVFLDYEGHPFWRADTGLFFLFGLLTKAADGSWVYEARWAHSKAEEGAQTKALIEYFAARRREHPRMHVYHYNHTERSALEAMAAEHGADQMLLRRMVEEGLFVDLLPVVRNGIVAGVESYGLKSIERFTGFPRSHDIDKGASAVVEYEAFGRGDRSDPGGILPRIARYNEDDVRATRALRDWLVSLRDGGAAWRDAVLENAEPWVPDVDDQITKLHAFELGTPEHLMGDLLGYWHREWRKHAADLITKLGSETPKLLEDPDAIAQLRFERHFSRVGKSGKPLQPGVAFTFPAQPLSTTLTRSGPASNTTVVFSGPEGLLGFASELVCDAENGKLELTWSEKTRDLGVIPTAVVLEDWVRPAPKPAALADLAAQLLDGSLPRVTRALLTNERPRFVAGGGPADGKFTDALADATRWVLELDGTCVPIQGPPGTGKTWMAAHLIHALVRAGKRVGVMAMSHAAIDNLLAQTLGVFEDAGDVGLLRAVRHNPSDSTPAHAAVAHSKASKTSAAPTFNVVAGTSWFFANDAMRENPVDVLLIDEAGQLALADAVAASGAAHNIVLLGDPAQLAQVASASHPNGSGASVLEHVLGEHATVPPDRGVFLTVTRRLHPRLCAFISDAIYDSRLTAHESCAQQDTAFGTGLRWLRAAHSGRSKHSPEEAELVAAQIRTMIGQSWTNKDGAAHMLAASDFMVVAPYNDQVRLLRETLAKDPSTQAVPVGTVDKFQGQEAAVVFFTMTTSTAADMPRDPKFLFSRNRLNVALSRAQCLAYLVCTEELLDSRATNLDDMRLISTVCAAVEHAEPIPSPLTARE